MTPPPAPQSGGFRILIPVTGGFHGRLRIRRSTGTLDSEGMERVLSGPSAQAITLARQLAPAGAQLVAVHVDKGSGEWILREALSHGLDQGILIEGTQGHDSDASSRAMTIADVYRQNGPFDAVIGPGWSEFSGFTGALYAVAGLLDLPLVVGVKAIAPDGSGFRIGYESLFGDYTLRIPRPCVVVAGDLPPAVPTAAGIHDAHREKGILRVQADQYAVQKPLTRRLRIEANKVERLAVEEVEGPTLVRRLRSRGMIADGRPSR